MYYSSINLHHLKLSMILVDKKIKALILVSLCIIGIVMAIYVVFGESHDFYVVVSESMIPSLQTGDIAIINRNNDILFFLKLSSDR